MSPVGVLYTGGARAAASVGPQHEAGGVPADEGHGAADGGRRQGRGQAARATGGGDEDLQQLRQYTRRYTGLSLSHSTHQNI